MMKLRMLVLACGALVAAGPLTPVAPAQDKAPPIQTKQVKKDTYQNLLNNYQQGGGNYRFVSGDETLTSGDFVSISRKGMGKVSGVFVYSDPKTGKLYVRAKAGQRPIAVPSSDIEKIERIRPAVGTTGKGGIKPAIETGEKQGPNYEIHTMTVHNGPETTMFHYGTSLSDAETNELRALERARTEVLRKRAMVDSLSQAIDNAAAPPVNIVATNTGGGYGYGGYPYYAYTPYAGFGYYSPVYTPWVIGWPGWNYGLTNYGVASPGWGWPGMYPYGGGSNSTVVVENTGSTGQSVAALTKALGEAETALATARKNYIAASQRAVYDPSGHIVAVRLEQ